MSVIFKCHFQTSLLVCRDILVSKLPSTYTPILAGPFLTACMLSLATSRHHNNAVYCEQKKKKWTFIVYIYLFIHFCISEFLNSSFIVFCFDIITFIAGTTDSGQWCHNPNRQLSWNWTSLPQPLHSSTNDPKCVKCTLNYCSTNSWLFQSK